MAEYFDPFKEYDKVQEEKKLLVQDKRGFSGVTKENISTADGAHFESFGESDPDFGKKPPKKRKKKGGRRGSAFVIIATLCLIMPLFLLANVFVSNYMLELQTAEFEKIMQDKVTDLENSFYDQVNYNADLVSYYVAEKCMDEVVEIFAISTQKGISQGTGFIVSANGYILTNAHVATYSRAMGNGVYEDVPCETITVAFADVDKKYEVEVVGFDTNLDLALLKFKSTPQGLQVCTLVDSVGLSYGEPCVAIGNAKSNGLSVTQGVVSNPMVNFAFTTSFMTASIQHSAPINNGNSGGPLYNMFGQVIGINTFKLNTSEKTEGMGYAMPSVIIKDWVNSFGFDGLKLSFVESPQIGGEGLHARDVEVAD